MRECLSLLQLKILTKLLLKSTVYFKIGLCILGIMPGVVACHSCLVGKKVQHAIGRSAQSIKNVIK